MKRLFEGDNVATHLSGLFDHSSQTHSVSANTHVSPSCVLCAAVCCVQQCVVCSSVLCAAVCCVQQCVVCSSVLCAVCMGVLSAYSAFSQLEFGLSHF